MTEGQHKIVLQTREPLELELENPESCLLSQDTEDHVADGDLPILKTPASAQLPDTFKASWISKHIYPERPGSSLNSHYSVPPY